MNDADNPFGGYFVFCETLEQLLVPNVFSSWLQTARNSTHLRLKWLAEIISVTGCKKVLPNLHVFIITMKSTITILSVDKYYLTQPW